MTETESGLIDETPYHWRVRTLYHPSSTPYQSQGRWLSIPVNGWEETDLRTGDPAPAGRVPVDAAWSGVPLTIEKEGEFDVRLSWGPSCLQSDTDYAVFEGKLGDYYSHSARFCTTDGKTTKAFTPLAGGTYYVVGPLNATREGSLGMSSEGVERPQADPNCLPRDIGACP